MKKLLTATSLAALSLFAVAACAEKGDKAGGTEATATKAPAAKAEAHPALDAYEKVRELLAADQIEEAVKAAEPLAMAAEASAKGASEKSKAHFEAMAKAAKELAARDAKNADDVRKQFGEVSRAVMGVLAAEPQLAAGRHAFSCPMAQGYKKWVQVTADMANPYMGKRMLKCGETSDMSM